MENANFVSNDHSETVIDMTPSSGTEIQLIDSISIDQQPDLPAIREMQRSFSYGLTKLDDIEIATSEDPTKKQRKVDHLVVKGEMVVPTPRFWNSIQTLYGFSSNIFTYFQHDEVFKRVSQVSANDNIRFCIQREHNKPAKLLAATRPEKAIIEHDMLMETLAEYGGRNVHYLDGLINSTHDPRIGGDTWQVGPDALVNNFCLEAPVDGYGKPCIYLSCLRQICGNGMIGRAAAFRTELNIGKGEDVVKAAVVRALDQFNSEEGYDALKKRFVTSAKSWASVYESNSLYKLLVKLHSQDSIVGHVREGRGQDSEDQVEKKGSQILTRYHQVTGDTTLLYGMANLEVLSNKRQRTLPVKCTVYDLVNLSTEVATHHANERGRQQLHAWVGTLIGSEEGYDLENTKEKWGEFADFHLEVGGRGLGSNKK